VPSEEVSDLSFEAPPRQYPNRTERYGAMIEADDTSRAIDRDSDCEGRARDMEARA